MSHTFPLILLYDIATSGYIPIHSCHQLPLFRPPFILFVLEVFLWSFLKVVTIDSNMYKVAQVSLG